LDDAIKTDQPLQIPERFKPHLNGDKCPETQNVKSYYLGVWTLNQEIIQTGERSTAKKSKEEEDGF
jgi:hypothetical protein